MELSEERTTTSNNEDSGNNNDTVARFLTCVNSINAGIKAGDGDSFRSRCPVLTY